MPQTGTEAALNYIRKRREEGISDQQIARELREGDWNDETIEDLLRRAESHDGGRIEADTSAEQTVSETPMEMWKKVILIASSFVFFPVGLVWGIVYLASDVSPDRKTIGKWAVGISLLMLVVVIATPTEEKPEAPAEEAAVEVEEPSKKEPSLELTAQELQEAYSDNAVAAKDKYEDKRVLVTGRVEDISLHMNQPHVSLGTDQLIVRVTCKFPEEASDSIAKLEEDDKITVNGIVAGEPIGMGVYIEDSKLVE